MTRPESSTQPARRGCTCRPKQRVWQASGVCATCGQRVLEEQLTPLLLHILCAGTGLVLWRNARGYDDVRKVRYGVGDGGGDYIGVYEGRFVAVEMKTATGRQQPNQRQWQQLVEAKGGVYAIVRNEIDARALLARLRTEVTA